MLTIKAILREYSGVETDLQKLRTEKKVWKKSVEDMINKTVKETRVHPKAVMDY